MAASTRRRNLWALGGILFAAFLIAGDVLSGALATGSLPLPGAPAQEVVRYFTESQTAVLAVASAQVMSALSLLVLVAPVATLVRRVADGRRAPVCRLIGYEGRYPKRGATETDRSSRRESGN